MAKLSARQSTALAYVARNPGCSAADVTRYEWSGRGHAATYARVSRLLRRGVIRRGPCVTSKHGVGLYVA